MIDDDAADLDDIARRILALPPEKRARMQAIIDAMESDANGTTQGAADRLMDMLSAVKRQRDE